MRWPWLVTIVAAFGGVPLSAQCGHALGLRDAVAGVAHGMQLAEVATSVEWDPDGAGPAQPVLVLAGTFEIAGSVAVGNIVAVDLATGAVDDFGGGLPGPVSALAVLPNGDLVAGGTFVVGGTYVMPVMRWTGAAWVPLGSGVNGSVYRMVVMPNGDLIAAGNIILGSSIADALILRWDGQAWHGTNAPLPLIWGSIPVAMAGLPNGDVFVATGIGLYRWSGGAWTMPIVGPVLALAMQPTGTMVAAVPTVTGNAYEVRRWNGLSWQTLGSTTFLNVTGLAMLPNGEVWAVDASVNLVVRSWNGTSWTALAAASAPYVRERAVLHLAPLANGEVLVAGNLDTIGGVGAAGVALWNGAQWRSLWSGTSAAVDTVVAEATGDVVVGGRFRQIGGVAANYVARWNGQAWLPLGAGLPAPVRKLFRCANGDLVAAMPLFASGQAVQRWDGVSWSPLGGGFTQAPTCFCELSNGELWAGGPSLASGSSLLRWNGLTWQPIGPQQSGVTALLALPQGGAYAAFGSIVQRWDGTAWSSLGAASFGTVAAMQVDALGRLVAVGYSSSGSIVCACVWNGSSFVPIGSGLSGVATDVLVLPDGDLLLHGSFTLGSASANFVRWNGVSWSNHGVAAPTVGAKTMVQAADGALWVGTGTLVQGQPAPHWARLDPTCPARTLSVGAGCVGSAGLVQLQALDAPWIGSTWRSTGTGIPANSVVFAVRGLTPSSLSLSLVSAAAVPGCQLLTMPVIVDAYLPLAGNVTTSLAIPDALSLVGLSMLQQLAPIEFGSAGAMTRLTSSNALQVTFGAL